MKKQVLLWMISITILVLTGCQNTNNQDNSDLDEPSQQESTFSGQYDGETAAEDETQDESESSDDSDQEDSSASGSKSSSSKSSSSKSSSSKSSSSKSSNSTSKSSGSAKKKSTTYTLVEADSISLSDFHGKVVVLNFWASWCPPCKQEMPDFQKMHQEWETKDDVVLLLVNLTDGRRETRQKAEQYLKDNGFTFKVLLDTNGTLAKQFRISSIPQTVILDRQGNVSDSIVGMTNQNTVMQKVNRALGA